MPTASRSVQVAFGDFEGGIGLFQPGGHDLAFGPDLLLAQPGQPGLDGLENDPTGGQIAIFGRLGSRPFNRQEMEELFLNSKGLVYKVSDAVDQAAWRPPLLYAN